MKIKVYAAKTMQEAIESIRKELGSDAIVLHSEKKTVGDAKGNKKTMYEVVAAVEDFSSIDSTETGVPETMNENSTYCESMLDDDVEVMIDESFLQTYMEETKIAEETGREGSTGSGSITD